MKKFMTMIIAIMFSIIVYSQNLECYTFSNELIEKTQATIIKEQEASDNYIIVTELPMFSSLDLVKLQCKSIASKYSDVIVVKNWTREGEIYHIFYKVDGEIMMISYDDTNDIKVLDYFFSNQ